MTICPMNRPASVAALVFLAVLPLALLCACGNDPLPGGNTLPYDSPDTPGSDIFWTPGADAPANVPDVPNASCPGGTFCPCTSNAACDSGICIDSEIGKVCSKLCTTECPEGWACLPVDSGSGDLLNVCVSRAGRVCDPCEDNDQCKAPGITGALCVNYGPEKGRFCGLPCTASSECPTGYVCELAQTAGGVDAKQCVKPGEAGAAAFGTCGCSPRAVQESKSTTCAVQKAQPGGGVVSCYGKRTCTADGLSPCDAKPAAEEQCDGEDDDCDGQTDEDACDDKQDCTVDACVQDAKGAFACTHEAIEGVKCDDGNKCTEKDACKAGACVSGSVVDCDDQLPCTLDECDKDAGCVYSDKTGPCDDGDACTTGEVCKGKVCEGGQAKDCSGGDTCNAGLCDPKTGACASKTLPDGTGCNDGTMCTVGDACAAGKCVGKKLNCDDASPCTVDACEPMQGCVHAAQGGPCDDGDACTKSSVCQDGKCVGLQKIPCDDSNPCTDDTCNAQGECMYIANIGPCEDGDPCTSGDQCALKVCNPGKAKDCQDNNPCTDDTCKPGQGCVHDANTAACDDGSVCTQGDACKGGACAAASTLKCDDGKPCTADTCDALVGCKNTPSAGACDDGDKCTAGDLCADGACIPGKPQSCDDANACTADVCDKVAGCQHTATTLPCDDGNKCTGPDACAANTCKGGAALACDDAEDCTADSCDPKTGCVHTPQGVACSDDNACTVGDACVAGKCTGKAIGDCDDKNPCTKDDCTAQGGCEHVAHTKPCDDGDPCTEGDQCGNKQCNPGKQVVCDDGNPCTNDACVTGKGCATTNNSVGCDDGNPCTEGDKCGGGQCQAGGPKSCDDGNPCTDDSCDKATGCKKSWNNQPCNDGNDCTQNDACNGGQCLGGQQKDCSGWSDTCNNGVCAGGQCVKQPKSASCDDGDPCTVGDSCSGGQCQGGSQKNCSYLNGECKIGVCSGGQCTAQNKSGSCNDGDACTVNDTCSSGSCKSGPPKTCTTSNPCLTAYCSGGGCTTKYKSGSCTDNNLCTTGDQCVSGSCKGTAKNCTTSSECKTAYCSSSSGNCLTSNKSKGTKCSIGACDGYGLCVSPSEPYTIDGCTGSTYNSACKSNCEGCKMQCLKCSYPGGFLTYNQSGCSGQTCFNRWPNHGYSGFVAMYTRSYQTAYGEWRFPKALSGNYKIYADLPNPQSWGLSPSVGCSSWQYATQAKYNIKKGASTLTSKTVNHGSYKGQAVLLFQGNATGVTGVTLGNGTSPSGCYMMLLDQLRAVPY